jgi:hypothetical protein
MRIPCVIDNQSNKLAGVLNGILAEHAHLRMLRRLEGFEPKAGVDGGLRPSGEEDCPRRDQGGDDVRY